MSKQTIVGRQIVGREIVGREDSMSPLKSLYSETCFSRDSLKPWARFSRGFLMVPFFWTFYEANLPA